MKLRFHNYEIADNCIFGPFSRKTKAMLQYYDEKEHLWKNIELVTEKTF